MWSGVETGHSNQADALALMDALSAAHQHSRQMQIVSVVSADVGDLDHVAVAAFVSGEGDFAVGDGLHWSSGWSCVVCPKVGAADLQNRVVAMHGEVRTYARGEAQRRAQESFLQ